MIRPKGTLALERRGGSQTLGRYDNVMVIEAPDEKTVMSFLLRQSHVVATETLTAIPKEEARRLT